MNDFVPFGTAHIAAMIAPLLAGAAFVGARRRWSSHARLIDVSLAIFILLIRFVRYGMDLWLGTFRITQLLSLHISHIDLIVLTICLLKPGDKLYSFTFLIGIPTALAVALHPGTVHDEPALWRAVFFVMSHMMLFVGSMYIWFAHRFRLSGKHLLFYHLFPLGFLPAIYGINRVLGFNFLHLNHAPPGTFLEWIRGHTGPHLYILALYLLYIVCLNFLYGVHVMILQKPSRHGS